MLTARCGPALLKLEVYMNPCTPRLRRLPQARRIGALAFLWTILFVASASAQQDASIVGVVTDSSGGILPGVSVSARSRALQVPQMLAVTDERGEYRLTPLPIGTYEVTYELTGFQPIRREGLRLTSGFTARVDVVMNVGGVQESITVSGASPVVDATATS